MRAESYSLMDLIYSFGPTVIGALTTFAIASYCWNKFRAASFIVIIWFSLAVIVSQFSFFPASNDDGPNNIFGFLAFGTLAFGPAVVLILLAHRSSKMKDFLSSISSSVLIFTQVYRIGGVFLILAFVRGDLPAEVGLVSGLMDVLVAITALVLSGYLRNDSAKYPRLIVAWAIFSLIDFSWVTLIKFATFFGVLSIAPAPVMLGNPPLLIISLFALPLGIFVSVYLIIRVSKDLSLPNNGFKRSY